MRQGLTRRCHEKDLEAQQAETQSASITNGIELGTQKAPDTREEIPDQVRKIADAVTTITDYGDIRHNNCHRSKNAPTQEKQ